MLEVGGARRGDCGEGLKATVPTVNSDRARLHPPPLSLFRWMG